MLSNAQLDERVEFLENVKLFKGLDVESLHHLADMTEEFNVSKGKTIYKIGEELDCLFILIKGMIKISKESEEKREVIKSIMSPTAVFGESAIYGRPIMVDTAIALEKDVKCLKLKINDLRAAMKNNWDLASNVITFLGQRKSIAEQRFESVVLNDARTRIIEFLKENADKLGQRIGYEMLIKHSLTQQDIANFTGTSRQTVTSVLNDLRKTNQIYFKRKSILIRDIANLS